MTVGRVLVFAPHADDEVIGCGGSVALMARRGAQVTVAIVTDRERSVHDIELPAQQFGAEIRRAAQILGVAEVVELHHATRDLVVDRALLMEFVGVIRRIRPDVVFVPHQDEQDGDHLAVHTAASQAIWMAASPYFVQEGDPAPPPSLVLGYEVWTALRQVSFTQDITEVMPVKLAAIRAYESQLAENDFAAAVQGLAAYRGAMGDPGSQYVEAFAVQHLHIAVADPKLGHIGAAAAAGHQAARHQAGQH